MNKTTANVLAGGLFVILIGLGGLSVRKRTDCFSCPVCGSCKTDTHFTIYGLPITTRSTGWNEALRKDMHEIVGDPQHLYDCSLYLIENPLLRKEMQTGEDLSLSNISPEEYFSIRFSASILLGQTDENLTLNGRKKLYTSLYSVILNRVNHKTQFDAVQAVWKESNRQTEAVIPDFLLKLQSEIDAEQ
jgi:hypothetical protein